MRLITSSEDECIMKQLKNSNLDTLPVLETSFFSCVKNDLRSKRLSMPDFLFLQPGISFLGVSYFRLPIIMEILLHLPGGFLMVLFNQNILTPLLLIFLIRVLYSIDSRLQNDFFRRLGRLLSWKVRWIRYDSIRLVLNMRFESVVLL